MACGGRKAGRIKDARRVRASVPFTRSYPPGVLTLRRAPLVVIHSQPMYFRAFRGLSSQNHPASASSTD